MKKLKHILCIVFLTIITFQIKSQTCSSPILLPIHDNGWQYVDSFSTSERWLKFDADFSRLIIKLKVYNYSVGHTYIQLYENNCSTLTMLSPTVNVSNDTISLITPTLTVGNSYLIKLLNYTSPDYLVYSLGKYFTFTNSNTLGCSTLTCSLPTGCELVCDGGFECINQVPTTQAGINQGWAQNWASANDGGSSDLFSTFSSLYPFPSVPCNGVGYSNPFLGNNYAGIILNEVYPSNYSEYLETKLSSTLQATKTYSISFWVKKATGYNLKVDEIGIFLTSGQIYNTNSSFLITNYSPAASTTNTTILNDYTNWQLVSFLYNAGGGEQYLTIGKTTSAIPSSTVTPPTFTACNYSSPNHNFNYLYIDQVSVKEAPPALTFTLPAVICQQQVISLNSLAAPGGGTFTGTGVTSSVGNYSFNASQNLSNGVYPIVYTYTFGTSCVQTITISAQVAVTNENNVSASTTSVTLCSNLGQTVTTLSASATNTISISYTWQPGNYSTSTLVVTPTVTTIYTVTANSQGCVGTQTVAVNVNSACCTSTVTAFNGNAFTTSSVVTASYVFNNDIEIPPGVTTTFQNAEYLFAPNVKITVKPGGALAIESCHLYGCSDMWQGIVIEDGGRVEMFSIGAGYNDNLFEDAIVGIDASNHITSTISAVTGIINAQFTTFNRNYVAINVYNYQRNQSVYPFNIHDNVFTSRTITFTPTSWPTCTTTGTSMRTASSATDGLAPPYLIQSFPISNLKSPYSAQSSQIGIQLNTVGNTLGTYSFNPIQIGRTTTATDFNIFDALGQGIQATNCNVLSLNNVFQNTQQYTIALAVPPYSYLFGGNGIRDIATGNFNSQLSLTSNTTNPSYANRFYDCHYAVNCDNVYSFDCKYATFRSTQSNTNTTTVAPGNTGISLRSNRMFYTIWNNSIANINTAINIPLSLNTYTYGSSSSGYGIYAQSIEIKDNYIGAQINPTTTIGNEYVNKAISISLPITNLLSISTNTGFVIVTNTLNNVYRGIDVNGISKTTFPATINENTITLQEDNAFSASQNAIKFYNNSVGLIKTNTLSAVSTTNALVSLLFESYNVTGTTTCNYLSESYKGFVFDNTNLGATWAGNSMQTHSIGLVLSNNGFIGVQGSSGHPIDNAWNGSWSGTFGGYSDNSNAITSPLWIKSSSPWSVPTSSGNVLPNQFYNAPNTTFTTTGTYSCATPVTSTIISNLIMPLDSVTDVNYIYIANTNSYRFLMDHDSIRNSDSTYINFCDSFRGTTIDVLKQVEDAFCVGDFATAYSLNSAVSPANGVEYYYQTFYNLYYNYETDDFSYYDSLSLYYLANACPGYYGPAIYQGRALYNYIYSTAFNFYDGCYGGGGGGLGRAQNIPGNNINSNLTKTWDCSLFPNPANNFVTLVSKNQNENLIIEVSDLNGKILLNKNIRTDGYSGDLNLDLSNGMYFVKITNSKNEKTIKKLVISK